MFEITVYLSANISKFIDFIFTILVKSYEISRRILLNLLDLFDNSTIQGCNYLNRFISQERPVTKALRRFIFSGVASLHHWLHLNYKEGSKHTAPPENRFANLRQCIIIFAKLNFGLHVGYYSITDDYVYNRLSLFRQHTDCRKIDESNCHVDRKNSLPIPLGMHNQH